MQMSLNCEVPVSLIQSLNRGGLYQLALSMVSSTECLISLY
jgi:hypothetical protein